MKKTYRGSCTCGSVRFECELDLAAGTTRCNCSFCRKNRFWMAFAPEGAFRLLQGEGELVDYQRMTPANEKPFLHFLFCGRCGVRAFTRGGAMPGMGAEFHAINLGCLDDATDEELAAAPIHFADGRHDAWNVEAPSKYL